MTLGFIYLLILSIGSIALIADWVMNLPIPSWVKGVLMVAGFVCWISGLAFLQEAEKKVFSKNNKHDD